MRIFVRILNMLLRGFLAGSLCVFVGLVAFVLVRKNGFTAEMLAVNTVYSALIGFGIYVVCYAAAEIFLAVRKNKWEKFVEKKGYCDEYFAKLEGLAEKSKGGKKIFRQLFYVRELVCGGREQEAVEYVKKINPDGLKEKALKSYYAAYLFALVMNGDAEAAEVIYGAGYERLGQTDLGNLSAGIYCYSREKYNDAIEYLSYGFSKSDNYVCSAAKLYLALCHLKNGDRELSKVIALRLVGTVRNNGLKNDLARLMRIIELSYGFDREKEKDKTQTAEEVCSENTETASENVTYEELKGETTDNAGCAD